MNPTKDEDFEMRWEVLEHMLRALPDNRQVALRTPGFKRRYLKMRGDTASTPLTAAEAIYLASRLSLRSMAVLL